MVSQMLCTWEAVCALCGPKIAATPLRSKWHTEIKQWPPSCYVHSRSISSYLHSPFALDYSDFRKLVRVREKFFPFFEGFADYRGVGEGCGQDFTSPIYLEKYIYIRLREILIEFFVCR